MSEPDPTPPAVAVDPFPAPRAAGSIYLPPLINPQRKIGGRIFDFDREVAVMAIVNRTPDSFYDQGRTFALDKAINASMQAIAEGADWIDIGGAPFAPGDAIPVAEELDRVLPVVRAIAAESSVVISVDTFHAEIARRCIEAGASVINDTTGLSDPEMAAVVADSDATLIITHSLAEPRKPHPRPQYDDIAKEIADYLRLKVAAAEAAGIRLDRIVIDPGHDLNKNTVQTLELTRRLAEITEIGLPTLAAVSNKDFIGETLRQEKADRLEGSLAAAVISIMQGARIIRMHNIAASVSAARMTEAVLGFRAPAYTRHNT